MEKLSKKINISMVIQGLVFVLCIVVDRVTKNIVVEYLKGKDPVPVIKDIVEFRYLENSGAAFGIFQNKQILFYIITIIVLVAVVVLWILINKKLKAYCFAESNKFIPKTFDNMIFLNYILVILSAGAIGNLVDRIITSYVVDFIYFKIIDFPIFNFADICVTISAVLLIIFFLFIYKEDPNFRIFGQKKSNSEEK